MYALPRIPIKDSDRRRAAFEEQHGEGGTELDALEAIHPGEIGRIVEAAIDRYREPTRRAEREIARIESGLRREIAEIRNAVIAGHATELDDLRASLDEAQAEIAGRQAAITDALAACRATIAKHEAAIAEKLEEWREDAAPVWEAIEADLEDALPAVDDIAWPQPELADEQEALYDLRRDYLTQVSFYKAHQGKPVGKRNGGGAS